jgi:hypothetical protein
VPRGSSACSGRLDESATFVCESMRALADWSPVAARGLRFPLRLLRSVTQTRDLADRANRILAYGTLRELLAEPRFGDPQRLRRHGFKAFSQNDEDGISCEIFRRIGTEQARFVEIGVGDGLENNTVFLLYQHWTGLWIEASRRQCRAIARNLRPAIEGQQLRVSNAAATPADINRLIEDGGAPHVAMITTSSKPSRPSPRALSSPNIARYRRRI